MPHSFHRVFKVSKIVETHRDPGGGDRWPVHLQQTLYAAHCDKINCKSLVTQQCCQILWTNNHKTETKRSRHTYCPKQISRFSSTLYFMSWKIKINYFKGLIA